MPRTRMSRAAAAGAVAFGVGCAAWQQPMPPGAGINLPPAVPVLDSPPPAEPLPTLPADASKPAPDPGTGPLAPDEVLAAVAQVFPQLTAAELERAIAAGNRVSAEGAFDLGFAARGSNQEGTFQNSRLDAQLTQATPWHGLTAFAGWRLGLGDFPVYNGGLKTAQGGEFRAGFLLPLLRDGPIDRRRATLRQAQLGEALADPLVRRVRLAVFRSALRAYWAWAAAGEQYRIEQGLLKLADDRERVTADREKNGAATKLALAQAQQATAERQGRLAAAAQRFQLAAVELSFFYRDAAAAPLTPGVGRVPPGTFDAPLPTFDPARVTDDVRTALANRPELVQFQLQKEQLAVEAAWAMNQIRPAVNLGVQASQDVGAAKKTFTGTDAFATDRTVGEAFLAVDLPIQRRDARGRLQAARARLAQTLANEKLAQDQIAVEVRSAVAALDQAGLRLEAARREVGFAQEAVRIARRAFDGGLDNIFVLNIQETLAAGAQGRTVDALADFYRALADYQAALGLDAGRPR